MDAEQLAREWEAKAKFWDDQASRMNRGRCHEGDRSLRIGMAAAARMCADQLRTALQATGQDDERQQSPVE